KEQVLKQLSYVSGIYSYSWIYRCEKDLDAIAKLAIDVIHRDIVLPTTFKVETKRTDKSFPLTSQQISSQIAGKILPHFKGLTVDVHNPSQVLNIEVRRTDTFVYNGQI